MLQFSNLTIETAVANQSGAMEADTILTNGRSSKSQTSRGNIIINMMIRRFILLLLVAVLTASYTLAQDKIIFGPRVGVNYTNKSINTSINAVLQNVKFKMKFKMKPGFQIGGIFETAQNENMTAQAGLLISTQKCVFDKIEFKSGKIDVSNIELPEDAILNLTYLRLPAHFVFKKDLGDVTFLAFGGYYLGLAVAGKILDEKIKFGGIGKGFMSRIDYGVNLGPGLQFGNVQAAIEYSIGFDFNSDSSAGGSIFRYMINNGFSLNLTYLFGK